MNFPLLEAVLSGLWQQRRRDLQALWIAIVSIVIAIGSLVASITIAVTA
jgi:ABC-type microcin C transport system permease subunit YejE